MPVNYYLKRENRKTLTMKVINGEVYVLAPLLLPLKTIEEFVSKHQRWINNRLDNPRINVNYDLSNDSTIYYKGKQYKLLVKQGYKKGMIIDEDTITLMGKSITSINKNFRDHLCSIIEEEVNDIKKELNVDFKLAFKFYKSKWGCCYKNDRLIVINVLSGCLDTATLRGVIYHEIAHLKVTNHQKGFYDYLSKLDPLYKQSIKNLKKYTIN